MDFGDDALRLRDIDGLAVLPVLIGGNFEPGFLLFYVTPFVGGKLAEIGGSDFDVRHGGILSADGGGCKEENSYLTLLL